MTRVRNIFGALYAWSAAVFLGAVLLDVVYASLLRENGGTFVQSVFGDVSDFLLIPAALAFFTALAAVALSWNVPAARNLFLAGLVVLALEFILPLFLFPLMRTSPTSTVPGISQYIRLLPLTLASLFALGGFGKLTP